ANPPIYLTEGTNVTCPSSTETQLKPRKKRKRKPHGLKMRSHWLFLALIGLLLPLMLVAATPPRAIPGGLKRIPKKNIGDPRLKLMAEFAVSMYNLRTHKKLVVERVIRGETQMVAGQNYQLVVLARMDRCLTPPQNHGLHSKPSNACRSLHLWIRRSQSRKPFKIIKEINQTVTMRSNCLLALVALVLALVACAADGRDVKVDRWQPVGDLSDPHVVEIAKFALSEFSKQSEPVQNKLVYYNMAKGETMVELGVRYKLVIGATNETIPDPSSPSIIMRAFIGFREQVGLKWVRDQAALAVLGLSFNSNGFILFDSSPHTGLFKIIRTPLVDDMNGEIPRIINLLGSKDLSTKVAAMNCVFGQRGKDLIKKLMGAQRLEVCLQSNEDKMKVFVRRREKEPKMEESVEKFPFSRCVASFAVQVEVGEALEQSEKRAFKLEILKRVREAAMVVAESLIYVNPSLAKHGFQMLFNTVQSSEPHEAYQTYPIYPSSPPYFKQVTSSANSYLNQKKKKKSSNSVNKSPVTIRPHCLLELLALVLPLASSAASTGRQGTPIGSWQPIKNISNPKVKEVAKFVVSEYNKQAQGKSSDPKLVLDSVVRGELQVVHGLKYKLVLSAKNESSVSNPTSKAPPISIRQLSGTCFGSILRS
ncbi:hypothetical protein Prudu_010703, partial [Prunus dulcis]